MYRATRLLAVLCLTAACYHATVETGATPSGETFTKDWASSWIYGLVPPSVVETARRCPNGVARVETQKLGWFEQRWPGQVVRGAACGEPVRFD